MSLILDALKKLDREKSSPRKATADISVEILSSAAPGSRKKILLYMTALSLTVVATAAITYAVIKEFDFLPKALVPAMQEQAAPLPLAREPLRPDKNTEGEAFPDIRGRPENKTPAVYPLEKNGRRAGIMKKTAAASPGKIRKPADGVTDKSPAARPSLAISGIIWHEGLKERRASAEKK